jgi:hypothetical protein
MAVDDFGKYLRYCELAARAMSTLRRIQNTEKDNPAEAQRLRMQRLEHELPAVIAFLETTRLKGWVLPRILTQWKNDLKQLHQQMDVELTACAKS